MGIVSSMPRSTLWKKAYHTTVNDRYISQYGVNVITVQVVSISWIFWWYFSFYSYFNLNITGYCSANTSYHIRFLSGFRNTKIKPKRWSGFSAKLFMTVKETWKKERPNFNLHYMWVRVRETERNRGQWLLVSNTAMPLAITNFVNFFFYRQ